MHQNPFTSPDSPGSASRFPRSRGRSACWARFRRSDRFFKLSCRWRKETLQEQKYCLETHTILDNLEPWISSIVGVFLLMFLFLHVCLRVFLLAIFSGRCTSNYHTPLLSCNAKKPNTFSIIRVSFSFLQMSAIPQTCSSIPQAHRSF